MNALNLFYYVYITHLHVPSVKPFVIYMHAWVYLYWKYFHISENISYANYLIYRPLAIGLNQNISLQICRKTKWTTATYCYEATRRRCTLPIHTFRKYLQAKHTQSHYANWDWMKNELILQEYPNVVLNMLYFKSNQDIVRSRKTRNERTTQQYGLPILKRKITHTTYMLQKVAD